MRKQLLVLGLALLLGCTRSPGGITPETAAPKSDPKEKSSKKDKPKSPIPGRPD